MKNRKVIITLGLVAMMMCGSVLHVAAADPDTATATNNKVTFVAGGGEEGTPVDPEYPDKEIEVEGPDGGQEVTGNKNSLRIEVIPHFDFGSSAISFNRPTEYNALIPSSTDVESQTRFAHPYFVQIGDYRGTAAGWTLSASLETTFDSTSNTLDGAEIWLKNVASETSISGNKLAPGSHNKGDIKLGHDGLVSSGAVVIASAAEEEGNAITAVRFGDWNTVNGKNNANESVVLHIPAKTALYAETYTADILWTLTNAPTDISQL